MSLKGSTAPSDGFRDQAMQGWYEARSTQYKKYSTALLVASLVPLIIGCALYLYARGGMATTIGYAVGFGVPTSALFISSLVFLVQSYNREKFKKELGDQYDKLLEEQSSRPFRELDEVERRMVVSAMKTEEWIVFIKQLIARLDQGDGTEKSDLLIVWSEEYLKFQSVVELHPDWAQKCKENGILDATIRTLEDLPWRFNRFLPETNFEELDDLDDEHYEARVAARNRAHLDRRVFEISDLFSSDQNHGDLLSLFAHADPEKLREFVLQFEQKIDQLGKYREKGCIITTYRTLLDRYIVIYRAMDLARPNDWKSGIPEKTVKVIEALPDIKKVLDAPTAAEAPRSLQATSISLQEAPLSLPAVASPAVQVATPAPAASPPPFEAASPPPAAAEADAEAEAVAPQTSDVLAVLPIDSDEDIEKKIRQMDEAQFVTFFTEFRDKLFYVADHKEWRPALVYYNSIFQAMLKARPNWDEVCLKNGFSEEEIDAVAALPDLCAGYLKDGLKSYDEEMAEAAGQKAGVEDLNADAEVPEAPQKKSEAETEPDAEVEKREPENPEVVETGTEVPEPKTKDSGVLGYINWAWGYLDSALRIMAGVPEIDPF